MNQQLACYGVKQWVCELPRRADGSRLRVFTTGDSKYYLFAVLDPNGIDCCMHISVKKTDLKLHVARYISRQFARPRRKKKMDTENCSNQSLDRCNHCRGMINGKPVKIIVGIRKFVLHQTCAYSIKRQLDPQLEEFWK